MSILLYSLIPVVLYMVTLAPAYFWKALYKIRQLQDYYDYIEYKTLNSMIENIIEENLTSEEIKSMEEDIHDQYLQLQTKFIFYRYIIKELFGLKTFPRDLYPTKLRSSELIPEEISRASKYLAQQQIMKYNTYLGFISARQPESFEKIIKSIDKAEEYLLKL